MNKDLIILFAIVGIVIIEIVALLKGHNGTLMTMSVAIIAGLAGWRIPNEKNSLEVKL